jgi:hypothetical protein
MKFLLGLFKGRIKALIVAEMQSHQDAIVTSILKKISTTSVPLTGEQEELVLDTLYDAVETIVAAEIDTAFNK